MSETVTRKGGFTLFRTRIEIAKKWRLETVVYFDSKQPLVFADCTPSKVLDLEVFKDSLSTLTYVKLEQTFLEHLRKLDFGWSAESDQLQKVRYKRDLARSFAELVWQASDRLTKPTDVSFCYPESR